MEQVYCLNCLRRIPAYPCPLCGYDPSGTPAVAQALEQCILRGRYLTGRVLEKNAMEILYRGRDLAEDREVIIREFFPQGKARRRTDGSLDWIGSPKPAEALPPQPSRRGETLLDSFSENNTIYTVCQSAPPLPRPRGEKRKQSGWLPFLLALLVLALIAAAAAPWLLPLLPGFPW